MSTAHCMLDLETLGTKRTSQIVSVGAVAFGPNGVASGEGFYARVKFPDTVTMERGTLEWWAGQPDAVRAELSAQPRHEMVDVCLEFTEWWKAHGCVYVWCHGATFDAPMLESHFPQFVDPFTLKREGGAPWHYADVRDTRTLYQLAGVNVKDYRDAPGTPGGVPHNALYDAISQAVAACAAIERLGVDWSRL